MSIGDVLFPPARFAGKGERGGEGRVVPALGDPAGVMQLAHCTQRGHQGQFADVEVAHLLVAVEQGGHRLVVVGEHPQILHRRAHARVVEIDEMRAGVGPQHIAGMAVAVQAQLAYRAHGVEAIGHGAIHALGGGVVRRVQRRRQQ